VSAVSVLRARTGNKENGPSGAVLDDRRPGAYFCLPSFDMEPFDILPFFMPSFFIPAVLLFMEPWSLFPGNRLSCLGSRQRVCDFSSRWRRQV
jgi:hypothetical protein